MKKLLFKIALFALVLSNVNAFAQEPNPVKFKIESKKVSATEYDVIFNATIEKNWHIYSINQTGDGPNPTRIELNKSADYELVGKLKESKPIQEMDKVFDMQVAYFKTKATFTQRIKVKTDKTFNVTGKYEFQTCTDEMCTFPPAKKFSLSIEQAATSSIEKTAVDTSTKTVSTPIKDIAKAQTSTEVKTPVAETKTADKTESETKTPWWLIFLKGIGFGLAALITPCVFPMIPMNVSFFLKRNKKRSGAIKEALFFMLSIIIIYTALGLLITAVFGETALNAIASSATFNIFFFIMLIIFGISFLGAFEIVLPNSWLNKIDSQSDRGGFIGIFFMATTLSLVSFSCTGIFIGNLIPLVSNSPTGPFFGFLGFGFGFALPFGLFAIVPSWLQSMPKSGGWLNTVKVTLGLLELALALKFASNADLVYDMHILTREVFLTLWIVLFGLTGIYLMGWFKLSHDTEAPFLTIPRLFFAILAFGFTVYMVPGLWGAPLKLLSGVIPPTTYAEWKPQTAAVAQSSGQNNSSALASKMIDGPDGLKVFHNDYESALAYAKEVHKPLMVDFTGHACANCRKMEDNVWVEPEIRNILANDLVIVSLFVDDRKELAKAEQKEVQWGDDKVTIETEGMKWGFMQLSKYKISSQPYYVIVNDDESLLSNSGIGYDTGKDLPVFKIWLSNSILKYKEKHP
ncbi:MAG TPA: thioredoxin family protein [Bacteroidia bacterium]|nr:thioredoxin family protein [Bacteroidia bacterium]